MDLHLPMDFERLPEFRQLSDALGGDGAATYVFMRLWVELGYRANRGDRVGFLSDVAAGLLVNSLRPPPPELMQTLARCDGLVQRSAKCEVRSAKEGEGWFCERFARLNGHLAADFIKPQKQGQLLSLLPRRQKAVQREADEQALLIAAECYKRRDGSVLDAATAALCRTFVIMLDKCLGRPPRPPLAWSAGLFADAADAVGQHPQEQLNQFARWLILNRNHPAVPQTTEQILSQWATVWGMMGSAKCEVRSAK